MDTFLCQIHPEELEGMEIAQEMHDLDREESLRHHECPICGSPLCYDPIEGDQWGAFYCADPDHVGEWQGDRAGHFFLQ